MDEREKLTRNKIAVNNYRARELGKPATLTFDEWQVILKAHKFCSYCGGTLLEPNLEHRIPLSDPDSPGTVAQNITISCAPCNNKKGKDTWTTSNAQLEFIYTST